MNDQPETQRMLGLVAAAAQVARATAILAARSGQLLLFPKPKSHTYKNTNALAASIRADLRRLHRYQTLSRKGPTDV